MSSTLRVSIDTAVASPAETIAEAARHVPFLAIAGRLYAELAAELGGDEPAVRHLARVATDVGKPIAVNVETGEDTSTTVLISPGDWTEERLKGWVAGHHEAIEELFGTATVRGDL
jgi:hypothetical protein